MNFSLLNRDDICKQASNSDEFSEHLQRMGLLNEETHHIED